MAEWDGVPVTPARRLQPPSWRDPRLLVGVVLVLAATALGARVVAMADETVPVYAARGTLPPGTPLEAERVVVVRLRLEGSAAGYLDATRPLPAARVVLRTVGAGEVIPSSGVGGAGELATRPVTVPLEGVPPGGLVAGGLADVWASPRQDDAGSGGYAAPRRLARDVDVVRVTAPGDGLAAGRATAVEVMLDEGELPLVLDALANGARTAVVPVPGAGSGGAP